ncbi:hypothetical protein CBR59_30190 [Bacillus thuringiensis]|uniref:Crystaline entomocidal protoxin n=1 Tax=Bacillus thuringiensis TaxID=1428 RepID=B8K258_BACTU|nr:insecticidal delta-endotoxin Cry8Ea1 family protein [Bacillus thuringiensis]ABC42043.1 toxin pbt145-1 [Bacillus thuringiensis]ACJ54705.1 spherical crystal protein [Bacillus thuringiensis]PNK22471.1 hypothetical protein CBP87_31310 [Bacillus thuringiensis]PNK46110.1 hypothetical protein CBR59_30190 [Bacillus thuringiensis]
MSPNNQNEYEIIDASSPTSVSNNSVKYPLASDQTTTLQNMNYKDYLRMSEGENPELFGNPETFISAQDAVGTGIDIVSKLLGSLGVPLVGQAATALKWIIGKLWPSSGNPWDDLMTAVEELINQKIEAYARSKALAELGVSGRAVKSYQTALEEWQKNPNNARSAALVRERFSDAEHTLRTQMSLFTVRGYEIPLLATYAQAANLHLFVMKDIQIYGREWGYTQGDINLFYREQVEFTGEYSDYCVKWYNAGLDKLRGSTALQWINYNRFRREMTVMALDIVALFPNYDIRMYPMKTTAELTRRIYTDPLGYTGSGSNTPPWYNYGYSFSWIENNAMPAPGLFQWLQGIGIYTKFARITPFYANYWSGHTVFYKFTNDSTERRVQYGDTDTPELDSSSFENVDIYKVSASVGSYKSNTVLLPTFKATFEGVNQNNQLKTFRYQKESNVPSQTKNSTTELPVQLSTPPTYGDSEQYSHRLAYVFDAPIDSYTGIYRMYGFAPILGWTHISVSRDNRIDPDKITQIPAVKAYAEGLANYIKDPGFTGGDLLALGRNSNTSLIVNFSKPQTYRIRIRYAASKTSYFQLRGLHNIAQSQRFEATYSNKNENDLTFNDFKYVEIQKTVSIDNPSESRSISIYTQSDTELLIIDKIEFIPVDATFEAEQDLDVAKKAVNGLFTNTKDALQTSVTDYQVNQAANLVECLSDELYPNEKRMLWDAVKEAKRLVQARNLLQDTGFNVINGENGWTGSTGIEVVEGDVLFKDRSLRLPSAREIDTETYPTYLYQQIDESLLKPYTRYRLRGFIGSSQDLEIKLIRHRANQIVKNVPDNLLPDVRPVNSCGGVDRCSEQQYVDANLALENNGENRNMSSDSHAFSFHMDTGEIDLNENTGIWVVFKIPTTNGYATLGNLELVEEGPLSGDALERLQREEQQWKLQRTKRREETDRKYMAAKQAIDRLFADYQDQQLNSGVEMSDLLAAQNLVQSIPYVYNEMFPEIPGMNYTNFTELTNRLQQAWNLYDLRNAIPNGDFRNGLSDWNATSDINVQQLNDTSVLVIPNWNSQVSQQFTVQPNYRYVLRVTARKEGAGDGYVIIRDGTNQTETLAFNTCDNDAGVLSTNQASYITKTVEFTPSTEQVWIDMSETEGVFNIESVELVLEEE